MRTSSRWKGSITVEGAIILPIFIIIVFTMITLTKLVFVHAIVQNALVQTTKEISAYSYIVKEVLQLNEIHETIEDVLGGNVEDSQFDSKLDDFGQAIDGNVDMIFQIGDQVMENPGQYGKELVVGGLSSTALNIYQDLLGEGVGLIEKSLFPVYVGETQEELDTVMKLLGVKDGLQGIRMKGKLITENDSTTLILAAAYTIQMDPPLSYFLNGKTMIQQASCVPWMGKDD